MDTNRFEKIIIINEKEKVVKIDKNISLEKSKFIVDEFCRYLKQMKHFLKKIEKYKSSDFDYIVFMLIIKNCTDLLGENHDKIESFVDITISYSDLFSKNILQQIFKNISDLQISKDMDKIIVTCRVIVQNEISIKRLENMLPEITNDMQDFDMLKIKKNIGDFSKIKNKKKPLRDNGVKKQKTQNSGFDHLLDQYSDAKMLYDLFGDDKYKKRMSGLLNKMKNKWSEVYAKKPHHK